MEDHWRIFVQAKNMSNESAIPIYPITVAEMPPATARECRNVEVGDLMGSSG